MVNKKLNLEELKELVFNQNKATKQNKDRLFKLAKSSEDIETIEKLANNFKFKSAKLYLNKKSHISLEDAINRRDFKLFKKFVEDDADMSKIKVSELIDKKYDDKFIRIFIEKGFYVNIAHLVKKNYAVKTIKLALEYGAKIDDVDNNGLTGVLYACEYKNNEILKLLLSNGANPNKSNSSRTSPLLLAVDKGCYENVKILLKYHADVNFQSSIDRVTPLIAALDDKNLEIVKLLLTERTIIDVNLQDINNSTALIKAAYENYIDVVKLLLEKKDIKLNIQGYKGVTALLNAIQNQNSEIASLLIGAGADANISNQFNANALNYALENLDYAMSKLLIKKGIVPITKKLDQKQIEIQNSSQILVTKFTEKLKESIKNKEMAFSLIQEIISYKNIETEFLNEYKLDMVSKKINKDTLNGEIIEFIEKLLLEELIFLEKINAKKMPKILLQGYQIDFFKKYLNIIMQQYLLGVYSKDEFSNISYDEYENDYLYRLILRDQIDGKVIVDIYENSLIHIFETNLGKRVRVEYKRINEHLFYDKKYGYIMIIDDYFIEKPLKTGVSIYKFNLIDEFNNIISSSKKVNHNPKVLSNKLKNFSNPKLQYTNHDWDDSSLTYDTFMKDLTCGWDEIKDDLETLLSSKTYEDIRKFLLEDKLGEKDSSGNIISWGDNITIGWSSPEIKVLGNKPHLYKISNDDRFNTFKDVMDIFKSLFVIKQSSKTTKILKRFTKLRKENNYGFNLDLDQLKTAKIDNIFTDVNKLELALATILSEINERAEEGKNNVKVTIEQDKITDFIILKIIHIGSTSDSDVETLSKATDYSNNSAGFPNIYKNLTSVCDWSIDTKCSNGKRYKIDYLYPEIEKDKPHWDEITDMIEGFTHILRFYK